MSEAGWSEPTCTLVLWRQGLRHPTRNECVGWFAQIGEASLHSKLLPPTPRLQGSTNNSHKYDVPNQFRAHY